MEEIRLNERIRLVEFWRRAKNGVAIGLDYYILFTLNGEERFCGYTTYNTLEEVIGYTEDYTKLIQAWNRNKPMPEELIEYLKH